jgi:hypothetical protein|tara:strand:- start:56 stop:619 length:564 start_codon:yes stop_codon:yes gene_type:complete
MPFKMEQMNLFETQALTKAGVIIEKNKGVDLSEIYFGTPERPDLSFEKNKYIIYPSGETHPFGHKIKSLSGDKFPFIVSTFGDRKSIKKPICRQAFDYPIITLKAGEKSVNLVFHKIVGRAFLKLPQGLSWKDKGINRKWIFHHKNKKKWDYRLYNLELITQKENCKDREKMDDELVLEQAKTKGLF